MIVKKHIMVLKKNSLYNERLNWYLRHNYVGITGDLFSNLPKMEVGVDNSALQRSLVFAFLGGESKPRSGSTRNKLAWSGTDESWVQARGRENKRVGWKGTEKQGSNVTVSRDSRDLSVLIQERAPEFVPPSCQETKLSLSEKGEWDTRHITDSLQVLLTPSRKVWML